MLKFGGFGGPIYLSAHKLQVWNSSQRNQHDTHLSTGANWEVPWVNTCIQPRAPRSLAHCPLETQLNSRHILQLSKQVNFIARLEWSVTFAAGKGYDTYPESSRGRRLLSKPTPASSSHRIPTFLSRKMAGIFSFPASKEVSQRNVRTPTCAIVPTHIVHMLLVS